ncbi:hydroxymethylglutaryl-CoA lyase [Salinicoccus sp. Marseille-QA3877]
MKHINIVEVGPRDGFQNLDDYIELDEKFNIIKKLVKAGVKNIQHTSFVSPKAVPQMKDARELSNLCLENFPEVNFSALVPNYKGVEIAYSVGLKEVAYVVSLSESHNKANINKTHEQSLEEFRKIKSDFPKMEVTLDLSTTFGCPFEGKKNTDKIVDFIQPYVELGVKDLNLCDTIGVANPKEIRNIINMVKKAYPSLDLQIHIHDTRNMGVVNTYAAIEEGVEKIQSTLGGLGGCPFAPGASGNLSTEDMVYMLNDMNYKTNVDFNRLKEAALYQLEIIPNGNYSGHHQFIK